jgi:hypothetical protein
LVAPLWHHIAHIGKIHPDPGAVAPELEAAHLVDGGGRGVDALVLNGGPGVALLEGDLGESAKAVKLPLDHLAGAPVAQTADPNLYTMEIIVMNMTMVSMSIIDNINFHVLILSTQGKLSS